MIHLHDKFRICSSNDVENYILDKIDKMNLMGNDILEYTNLDSS